ncbi:ankyrin repeat-containing protein BDA1-like [Pistacia vera]|uniref:ankyrin repeat-containing protein BDA1-like n=1 Tax=Pistacia vera TaxID=55513 RepID=UPI001262B9A5|nr:ankyrin repeat-containing protein BDA1-like [Pistacia vera]
MEIGAEEADNTQTLYEASMRGCVATLNTLIQNDPFICHKISLTAFTETPLHISALLGHVEFSKALVSQKPQLVTELDSFKRSPLHLASAEGHTEIVKELLQANKKVCLVADEEGRIPLHLAAMRGRVEVIQELISAKPESILVQINGETVLHLCVRYNHLDALKLLMASVNDEVFLNSKNLEGNTILQVSAMLKQFETTRYLLSVPKIKVDVNSLIENGFAAIYRNGTIPRNLQNPITETTTKAQSTRSATKKSKAALKKEAKSHAALLSSTTYDWSKKVMKYKSNNYENIRGNLIVVATLIAAMSFQVATNPPGGDWKSDGTNKKDQNCTIGAVNCIFKTSINEYTHDKLVFFSTLSFSASLSIILWLISGVPLKNRVSVGILLIGMWATVLFVAATYYLYISLAMPHDSQDQYDHVFDFISVWYLWLWAGLLAVIIAIHTLRFCWWVVKKLFMGVVYIVRCCCCCCCYKNKKNQHHDQIMVSV